MAEALANLNIEPFVEAPNTAANAIYVGAVVVKGGTNTTLQNPNHFTLIPGGLFRQVGGSGGGGSTITSTLSGLSDVNISAPTNGQPLVYNTTSTKWENQSSLTASLQGNASTATSASFATTASYALSSNVVPQIRLNDNDTSSLYNYCGTAPSGSAQSSAVWTIRRINWSSTTPVTQVAVGAWTNRTSLIYT